MPLNPDSYSGGCGKDAQMLWYGVPVSHGTRPAKRFYYLSITYHPVTSGPHMAETRIYTQTTEAGEETVATNGKLEIHWTKDAELVLLNPHDKRSRVAGGPLFELAPPDGERRPHTHGLGFDEDATIILVQERFADAHGEGIRLTRRFPVAIQPLVAIWTVTVYDDHEFVRSEVSLRNTGDEAITVRRMFPFVTGSWWAGNALRLRNRTSDFAVYKNGWQSWSYAGGMPLGTADLRPHHQTLAAWHSPGGADPHQPVTGTVDVVSEPVAMVGHADQKEAFLAGFLSAETWLGQVYVMREEGACAAAVLMDDAVLQPGKTLAAAPLALALGSQRALPGIYAGAVAREGHARTGMSALTGWSSWYYYYSSVTEEDILENLTALRGLRGGLPIQVIQIDDGYQTAVGDWLTANEKFPHGMKALADRIRSAGYRPGLWVAPFTVAANSRLAREHPEWLVHDAEGQPVHGGKNWDTQLYGLDTSHPGAREWLQQVFQTIVHEWGFDYLKLDFLASGALLGERHDAAVTRARAMRDGLGLIREVAGEKTFLLGCGCPLLSAVGIVDGMRIGPDSAPYWPPRAKGFSAPLSDGHVLPNLEGAVRNTVTRAWMHPALWVNDPDCLLLRERHSELTLDEVHMFASAIGLTGGMVMFSDRLSRLTLDRLSIASKLIPSLPERALPANYFPYGIPDELVVQITRPWGEWVLLGLFNQEQGEREFVVRWSDLGLARGEYHTVEFWSGTYHGLSSIGITVPVAGHSAVVLAIRADGDEPRLLSTSFHISQGGVEIADWSYDRERMEARWATRLDRQALGTFTLWVPNGLLPRKLRHTAASATWQRNAGGEIVVTAEIRGDAQFTLELERESKA